MEELENIVLWKWDWKCKNYKLYVWIILGDNFFEVSIRWNSWNISY